MAVCLSMYTIGATARYDGVELGTVHSARSVSAAVDQLEEITRQTLSDTDYSIDSAKLEVRTGIVPRKELESTDALEENLTRAAGAGGLCLCAVCGGGAGGGHHLPRRHRAAAGAAEKRATSPTAPWTATSWKTWR